MGSPKGLNYQSPVQYCNISLTLKTKTVQWFSGSGQTLSGLLPSHIHWSTQSASSVFRSIPGSLIPIEEQGIVSHSHPLTVTTG